MCSSSVVLDIFWIQPERRARCAAWFSQNQNNFLQVKDCHPRQCETRWVMQKEPLLPDSLLSYTELASVRDSDAGLQSLSIWIKQWSVYWSRFVFHYLPRLPALCFSPVRQYWAECNNARHITHTLADSNTHRQAQRKWREERKRHWEVHTGSEQSVAGCKKACVWTGGECKAGFTPNPEKTESSPGGGDEQKCSQPKQKLLSVAKCAWAE